MEQNAIYFLTEITNSIKEFTDRRISKVSFNKKENEWRSYINISKPNWEDFAWRVKSPDENGNTEFFLGVFSSVPSSNFRKAIDEIEAIGNDFVEKNENGIRFIWKAKLDNKDSIDEILENTRNVIPEIIEILKKYGIAGIGASKGIHNIEDSEIENKTILFMEVSLTVYDKFDNMEEEMDDVALPIKDLIESYFGIGDVEYYYKFDDQSLIDDDGECVHSIWCKIENIEEDRDELIPNYEETFIDISRELETKIACYVIESEVFDENLFIELEGVFDAQDYMRENCEDRFQSYFEGEFDEGNYC